MNPQCQQVMKEILVKRRGAREHERLHVLDVGAYDVNGTYRPSLPPAWLYTGSDIRAGPNVDVVQRGPYDIQLPDGSFDIVLCGQVLEHVPHPAKLIAEIARLIRPGGLVVLTCPSQWPPHDFPADYWRALPAGMMVWLADAHLDKAEAWTIGDITYGIGERK